MICRVRESVQQHQQLLGLDGLPLLQVVMYVVDKRVGDLGDVDQAGLPIVQATNAPNLVMEVTFPSKMLPT